MADLTGAEEILAELEALSIQVGTDGQVLELVGPRGALRPELAEEIRSRKRDLLELVELQQWPEASREAVRRHGEPWARLYPFLGKSILTPRGAARLVGVLPERATVVLDAEPSRASFFLPSELRPPGAAGAAAFPEPEVH
jgi:hypothetical protein